MLIHVLKKKKRWKKDSILTVLYKSLYKKQYGNQRIPANLWQFFFSARLPKTCKCFKNLTKNENHMS